MEDTFGILYRKGPPSASNTFYVLKLGQRLSVDEMDKGGLVSVNRYEKISWDNAIKMQLAVSGYHGSPDPLLKRIDKILEEKPKTKNNEE